MGGFGNVDKAIRDDGEQVALKHYRGRTDCEMKLQTFREIKFLKKLHNEHIIQLLDVITEQNTVSIITPLYRSNLESEIKRLNSSGFKTKEKERLINNYFTQMLKMLTYLRSQWIVHRDMKPSNILMSDNNTLILCDFGNAVEYHTGDTVSANVVTPNYRPPEGFGMGTDVPEAIDIWGVGCILFELITDTVLFKSSGDFELLKIWEEYYHTSGLLNKSTIPSASIDCNILASLCTCRECTLHLLQSLLQFNPEDRVHCYRSIPHEGGIQLIE